MSSPERVNGPSVTSTSSGAVPNWRGPILRSFARGVPPVTLVADPDGLFVDESLSAALRARGFGIVPLADRVAFRYAYEAKWRVALEERKLVGIAVVIRSGEQELGKLPCDLLRAGRRLAFGLATLFPAFNQPVVAALARADLDSLYAAQARYGTVSLGADATKDFALLHVFGIAPEGIAQPSDLLRMLLRRHYGRQDLPKVLDERLIRVLRRRAPFARWPLDVLVPDREAFLAFLQERWPLFRRRHAASGEKLVHEPAEPFGLTIAGPADLPFDHPDVSIYIDDLFAEGLLRPAASATGDRPMDRMSDGVRANMATDALRRLDAMVEGAGESIPVPEAPHRDWVTFAYRWATLNALRLASGANHSSSAALRPEIGRRIAAVRERVDSEFHAWMARRYAGLHDQPPDPPVMVHHAAQALARTVEDCENGKAALIVVDGLSLDQWIVLRDELALQRPGLRFRESAVFAWVPTVTSISRQAIFAGTPPLYFPSSIYTTAKESSLWERFWLDRGLVARHVVYARGLGDGALGDTRTLLERLDIRVAGLVVDKIDKIMHGMALGAAGMHNQIRQWAGEGYMAGLLDMLFDGSFSVFLTSDHGNIEARGSGRPSEAALANIRGERARIYSDPLLRSRVKERFPEAVEWPAIGLPDLCYPLLAPERSAFATVGARIVAHGGAALEEVVVPMIRIERSAR